MEVHVPGFPCQNVAYVCGQYSGMWWCSWWLFDGVARFWIYTIPLLQGLLYVPFEDNVTEMEKTISMLLEEVSQKVWQDMTSPLVPGRWTTNCKYSMLRGAGQHVSYWSAYGRGHCYSLLIEDPSHLTLATDPTQSSRLIKRFFAACCWWSTAVPARLYSVLLNM
jgi:hypothetical protein